MDYDIRITHERDRYVVYVGGSFFCTTDTYLEAIQELEREGFVV